LDIYRDHSILSSGEFGISYYKLCTYGDSLSTSCSGK
jgi:hypothetical protein